MKKPSKTPYSSHTLLYRMPFPIASVRAPILGDSEFRVLCAAGLAENHDELESSITALLDSGKSLKSTKPSLAMRKAKYCVSNASVSFDAQLSHAISRFAVRLYPFGDRRNSDAHLREL